MWYKFIPQSNISTVQGLERGLTFTRVYKVHSKSKVIRAAGISILYLQGEIIKMRFVWLGDNKPVGTVFIGTTPELEMALYTLCFLVKPDSRCPVQLAGKRFQIQTWTQSYQGKTLVGSAYPEI